MPHSPRFTSTYTTPEDMAAELAQLIAQVDAHRFALSHVFKKMPPDTGRNWLAIQANIFETGNNTSYNQALVAEIDALRELACHPVADAPFAQHQRG